MDLADKREPEARADPSKPKVSASVSSPTDKKPTSIGVVVKQPKVKKWLAIAIAVAMVGAMAAVPLWNKFFKPSGPGIGFVNGNGRIEATEIDVAAKLAGRIEEILVDEGEFVELGQSLVRMNVDVLKAQREEAIAQSKQASASVTSARAQVTARQSDTVAAIALVGQRESELVVSNQSIARIEELVKTGAVSMQELDDDKARVRTAEAALAGSKAQVAAAEAATVAAQAQVAGAGFAVTASQATIARIDADIEDSQIKSPRDGRIQYRVAQPGEVLAGGGKVLNLVDLGDVYLTFFLPETVVGKVAIGSEVRVVLDALPKYVIPAEVSYVSSTAQFTPKTVETASERQKMMFRVKAQINNELLHKHFKQVKTGLPGIAWLKIDPNATWPENLQIKVPE
jgi:HlyD family secretion protein